MNSLPAINPRSSAANRTHGVLRLSAPSGSRLLALILSLVQGAIGLPVCATDSRHDYDPPRPGSYVLPVIGPAAGGALLDTTGKPVRLADLTRGRITVMSFIYTRCAAPRACPMATGVLRELHRESVGDPALAAKLRLVSLSFDPAHDTPARMNDYAAMTRGLRTAAPWHFVTAGSQRELDPILEAYGQAVNRKADPREPTGPLNHTLRVFLIDRLGRLRNIYSSATLDPRLVLADIRTLALEAPSPVPAR